MSKITGVDYPSISYGDSNIFSLSHNTTMCAFARIVEKEKIAALIFNGLLLKACHSFQYPSLGISLTCGVSGYVESCIFKLVFS